MSIKKDHNHFSAVISAICTLKGYILLDTNLVTKNGPNNWDKLEGMAGISEWQKILWVQASVGTMLNLTIGTGTEEYSLGWHESWMKEWLNKWMFGHPKVNKMWMKRVSYYGKREQSDFYLF